MADLRPLRVYIAAPWVEKEAAKTVARVFEAAGFDVTSRWHDKHHQDSEPGTESYLTAPKDEALLQKEASDDLEDILKSQGMVVLQYAKSEGKAFEQGFILAASQFTGMNNKIIVVTPDGTRGNVFQYLKDIYTVVPDVDCALQEAKTWPGFIPVAEIVEDALKDTTDAK